jgi:aminoglycoside phosphotransferase (APT) family kinase protein
LTEVGVNAWVWGGGGLESSQAINTCGETHTLLLVSLGQLYYVYPYRGKSDLKGVTLVEKTTMKPGQKSQELWNARMKCGRVMREVRKIASAVRKMPGAPDPAELTQIEKQLEKYSEALRRARESLTRRNDIATVG